MAEPRWTWHAWRDLTPDLLHAFLKLRSDIFVVEQNCVFPEMDGLDPVCEHLCGHDASGMLVAYLRLVPPGVKYPLPAIGRLVVHQRARKTGAGRAAMLQGLRQCALRHPGADIFLQAQQHLEPFYGSLGFTRSSEPYLEDGIWHVDMIRKA